MQLTSRTNSWGKGVTDTDWVYGYNAWTALVESYWERPSSASRLILETPRSRGSQCVLLPLGEVEARQLVGIGLEVELL